MVFDFLKRAPQVPEQKASATGRVVALREELATMQCLREAMTAKEPKRRWLMAAE